MTKRRFIGNMFLLMLIGGSFGAAVIVLLRFADGPATASTSSLVAQVKGTPSPTPDTTAQVQGQYAGFSYPGVFDSVSQNRTDATLLEQMSLSAKSEYRVSIQASVRLLPPGGLNEDSSFRLRANNTLDYKPSDVLAGRERAILMTRADASEQTLFVPHNNVMLTIAVTSSSSKLSAAQIMAVVLPSVRWIK